MTDLLFDDSILPPDHRSGFIAVIGRPNVGKSTLMNYYLGQKIAIVSPKSQTTRHALRGILTLPTAQLIFVDTPGIHKPHHSFGEYMVDVAISTIPEVDLILWLVDATSSPTSADELVVEAIQTAKFKPPIILGLNKIDLLSPQAIQPRLDEFLALYQPDLAISFSAIKGPERDELRQTLIDQLPLGPRFYPQEQVTDLQTRFIASEMIREAALNVLDKEVPHATAVLVNEFKKRPNNTIYISANLFVERDSQKGIVIGKGGKTLKEIGRRARPQIEKMVDAKVYLELHVKVRPKWRKNKTELKRLGYSVGD